MSILINRICNLVNEENDMKKGKITINAERCKACYLCIDVCKDKLISAGKTNNMSGYTIVDFKDNGKCTACKLCAIVCPEAAIEIYEMAEKSV